MLPTKKRKLEECQELIFTNFQLNKLVKRVRVIQLREVGWKNKEISQYLNISRQSITKIKNTCSFDDLHSFIEKLKSGRVIKYDEKEEKRIVKASQNIGFSPRKYKRENPNAPSRSTVQRILKRNNLFPYKRVKSSRIKEYHLICRYEWCKLMKDQDIKYWESILFTDSKIFRLDGGYNPQNQRHYLTPNNKGSILHHSKDKISKGIHYYGGLSHLGLTDLIEVKDRVNSSTYVKKIYLY